MGIIQSQDSRPRDWAYKAVFSQKDLPSLQEMAKHIRETHDVSMIEDFNLKCEQKLAGGQTTTAVLDNGIEIQSVTKTEDLVVNVGLQQCINIILGTNSNRWINFGLAKNSGTNPPQVTDTAFTALAGGPWYIGMSVFGWSEAKGMKMFFGTITPQAVSSSVNPDTVHEIGVTTGQPGILLNREFFFNNPLSRSLSADGQMYKQVFMFSCVIEFCPVA
jgi:hypothetical protein